MSDVNVSAAKHRDDTRCYVLRTRYAVHCSLLTIITIDNLFSHKQSKTADTEEHTQSGEKKKQQQRKESTNTQSAYEAHLQGISV